MPLYRDDPVTNKQFIKAVQNRPCLYNFKLREYARKDITEAAWEQIALEMSDTVQCCKEKWRNIRTVFVRKLKENRQTESGRYKRPYYLTKYMQFLLPFLKGIVPEDSILEYDSFMSDPGPIRIKSENMIEFEDSNNFYTPLNDDNEDKDEDNEAPVTQEQIENDTDSHIFEPIPTISIKPHETSKESKYNDQEHYYNRRNVEEPRKHFLLSLLPDVLPMTDEQMRRFKIKALELVDNILAENSS